MAIQTLEIDHILVFLKLRLSFDSKINILIGENGLGKTWILKMIYAAASDKSRLEDCFVHRNISGESMFVNRQDGATTGTFRVLDGKHFYLEQYNTEESFRSELEGCTQQHLRIQSVYIPTTEMLSHAAGFLALDQKYNLPFDATEVDIIADASLPAAKSVSASMRNILNKISVAIDGHVVQENDTFYIAKSDGRKVDFSLETEGFRKLGLLWKLIRNGLLKPGSILLWDEPETNLHPKTYELVADVLLDLADNGVQIFVTTHSYNFAKYLEIRRRQEYDVQFIDLYKDELQQVQSRSAYYLKDLNPNSVMQAEENLLDEVYKRA